MDPSSAGRAAHWVPSSVMVSVTASWSAATFKLDFAFLDYHEHAVGRGANATAACYVEIQDAEGRVLHGVGIDPSIVTASLKATLSAVQRLMAGD